MSEENLQLNGNANPTPNEKNDSDDTAEIEALIKSLDNDENDEPVSREELKNIAKGIQKIAVEVGRMKKANVEVKPIEKKVEIEPLVAPTSNAILKKLYSKECPEIETVWDEIVKEAPKGVDPIEYYESKTGWQLEAKARHAAKIEEETNKQKIDPPANGTVSKGRIDISKVKPEEVSTLTPSQKTEWLKVQADKERNSLD